MIRKLDDYNRKRKKIEVQRESSLLNAKELYKEKTMILVAFKNGALLLSRQYPSGIHG